MSGAVGPLSPKQAASRVPPRASGGPAFAQALRTLEAKPKQPETAAKPKAPKLESLMVARFLKEAKVLPDGDARAPLLNSILADHLIEGGSLDLDLEIDLGRDR